MPEQAIHDDVLGVLAWNDDLGWWEGRTELISGHSIGISISADEDDPDQPPLEPARQLVLRLREDEPTARLVAAEELLDIYNEEWNEDDPLSEDEFTARLTLDDLSVAPDGSAELFYKDDDLFAGHTVVVTVGADGNFADADIAG